VADFVEAHPDRRIKILYNPTNQGYGGNQKLGYQYGLTHGFDVVVLLHGDGQYAPELLAQMIEPIVNGQADVVLGSRMIDRMAALRGKMPFYKWIGNQILTAVQNRLLGSHLTEFHTGYRAYSTRALRQIPFEHNSNYFDFDTDILIQMLDTGQRICEIPIPTYYGDEISHVNGLRYAILILWTTTRSRIAKLDLLYDRRFDYATTPDEQYSLKAGYPSSHQFALDQVEQGAIVLDIGSGPGYMAKELHARSAQVISVDRRITSMTRQYSVAAIETEIEEFDFADIKCQAELVFLLDIIEHVREPEELLLHLRRVFAQTRPPTMIITTGNVAFFVIRLGLLAGQFNYGRRGILDRDHHRLFTFASMKRLLDATGYDILQMRGIPAPYPQAIGQSRLSRLLLSVNSILIHVSRGLFSYQIAAAVRPRPMSDHLLEHAHKASLSRIEDRSKSDCRGTVSYQESETE
jgi:SAM-dependent methyltransferase